MGSSLLLTAQFLSLCLWVGTSFALFVLVGPHVMKQASSERAGQLLMSDITRGYSGLFVANALFLLITLFVQTIFLSPFLGMKLRLASSLVSLALFIALYDRHILGRRMRNVRKRMEEVTSEEFANHDDRREFLRLHSRSLFLLFLNSLLGIGVIVVLIFNI